MQNISNDYIVEYGTSGIWTYVKYASGIAECWGKQNYTISGDGILWQTPIYAYTNIPAVNYPFTFYTIPMEVATPSSSSSNAFWIYKQADSSMNNTTTHTAQYAGAKVSTFDNGTTLTLSFYVKGLWKAFK